MLIIDTREGKLIELIKKTPSMSIPYEIKNLQIGDIIISSSKFPEKSLIIERKCMTDMIASIKDGRYKEQKLRLQAEIANSITPSSTIPNTRICYLIEGNISDLRSSNDKPLFYGSMVSSIFRDTIPLLRTHSLNETLELIIRLHERMNKDITDFFGKENKINHNNTTIIKNETILETENKIDIPEQNVSNIQIDNTINTITEQQEPNNLYLQSIKKCKKENLTPKLWNQIALTNIPGISTTIAIKINESYPTIRHLLQSYDNCATEEECIKLISELILTETEKQKRRIGTVVSKRIYEYLYLDTQ
jgi:ERCC4-type nuclease